MEKLLINTPQNVQIEYRLASVGTRLISTALDYAVIIGYAYFVSKMFDWFFAKGNDPWLYYGTITLFILPALFYHFILETALGGQTLGKMAMKTKVVKIDGTRATVYEYFIRWVMSIVDIWMLSGLIGLVSIILSKKSQRIGDFAADTTVVNLKAKLQLIETVYEELHDTYEVTYPQVIKLTDKDINIIKETLNKSLRKRDYHVIDTLAEKVLGILEIGEIMESNIVFLETVIQDHYHSFRDVKN